MNEERWDTGVDYDDARGGGGRFGPALRRVFGDGENPLEWSVPIGRFRGISVRVHLIFPVFIAFQLIWTLVQGNSGIVFVAPLMVSLFVLVLLHEFGHCFACRRVGGEADKIIMWPLGGLAMCRPPRHWRADLMTTLGGPGVNAALWPLFAAAVYVATDDLRAVLFNPLGDIGVILGEVTLPQGTQPWWLTAIWSLHFANTLLLLFNMLVPMFPMDAGRVLQALIWRKAGWRRSMEITAITGIVAGGVLGVFAIVSDMTMLLAIAGLGLLVCYQEHRKLKFLDHGGELKPIGLSDGGHEEPEPPGPTARERKRTEREATQQVEIDRILAKISVGGMESLTVIERRVLKRATKRSRESE